MIALIIQLSKPFLEGFGEMLRETLFIVRAVTELLRSIRGMLPGFGSVRPTAGGPGNVGTDVLSASRGLLVAGASSGGRTPEQITATNTTSILQMFANWYSTQAGNAIQQAALNAMISANSNLGAP